MKFVRIYTGPDNESHTEVLDRAFTDGDGTRTELEATSGIIFAHRAAGGVINFHNAPRLQYVIYLTASVEVGLGDGTSTVMEPGDVLRAEDVSGHGHTSTVRQDGVCAFVPIAE